MPTIRYRAHGFVCAVVLYEIPDGETAYVKNKLKQSGSRTWAPVRWMGFICKHGARKLAFSHPGKLIASAVTNGNGISGEWIELRPDQYVGAMLVQIDDSTYGAYAVVDQDCWPVIRSDDSPRLTVVTPPTKGKILSLSKKLA